MKRLGACVAAAVLAGCANGAPRIDKEPLRQAELAKVPQDAKLALPVVTLGARQLGTLEAKRHSGTLYVQCGQLAKVVGAKVAKVCPSPQGFVNPEEVSWADFKWRPGRQRLDVPLTSANRLPVTPEPSSGGIRRPAPEPAKRVEWDRPMVGAPAFDVTTTASYPRATRTSVRAHAPMFGGTASGRVSTRDGKPQAASLSYDRGPHSANVRGLLQGRAVSGSYRFYSRPWQAELATRSIGDRRATTAEGGYRWQWGDVTLGAATNGALLGEVSAFRDLGPVYLRAEHEERTGEYGFQGRGRETTLDAFTYWQGLNVSAEVRRDAQPGRVRYRASLDTRYSFNRAWEVGHRLRWRQRGGYRGTASLDYSPGLDWRSTLRVGWSDRDGLDRVGADVSYRGDDVTATAGLRVDPADMEPSANAGASFDTRLGRWTLRASYSRTRGLRASVGLSIGFYPGPDGYSTTPDRTRSMARVVALVFRDQDGDGERDPGEPGLEGVKLEGYEGRTGPNGKLALRVNALAPVRLEVKPESLGSPYLWPPEPRRTVPDPVTSQRVALPVERKRASEAELG